MKKETIKSIARRIITVAADMAEKEYDDIIGTSQKHDVLIPRQAAMVVIRTQLVSPSNMEPMLSLAEIGSLFKGRLGKNKDHATILHALRKHDNDMATFPRYANFYNELFRRTLPLTTSNEMLPKVREIDQKINELMEERALIIERFMADIESNSIEFSNLKEVIKKKEGMPTGAFM
jgi:hypothetical protein